MWVWGETIEAHKNAPLWLISGAKDGIRTRDPDLGKVVLYQLSYFRVIETAKL